MTTPDAFAPLTNRYYVLRHGESEANVRRLIVGAPANGRGSYGLTRDGRLQVASSLLKFLRRARDVRLDLVVSSPFLRARQSARIAGAIADVEIRTDARLRERGFGPLELKSDAHYEAVWAEDRVSPSASSRGVESAASVFRRAMNVVGGIERRMTGKTLLLCTHGDVASVLICGLMGRDLSLHRQVGALGVGAIRRLVTAASGRPSNRAVGGRRGRRRE